MIDFQSASVHDGLASMITPLIINVGVPATPTDQKYIHNLQITLELPRVQAYFQEIRV